MKRITLMFTMLSLAGCAGWRYPGDGECGSIPEPPAQYDHQPTVAYIPLGLPWAAVSPICDPVVGNPPAIYDARHPRGIERYLGCSYKIGNVWRVVYPIDAGEQTERCTLRHELGHVNGWPATHPGARFV